MICIPIQVGSDRYDILIVLEKENIDRIMEYDPAEVVISKLGSPWKDWKVRTVSVLFATKPEIGELQSSMQSSRVLADPTIFPAVIEKLYRGWKYRPEAGDHDDNYPKVY